jgi:multidrug transporter EmrE-like cation transporter
MTINHLALALGILIGVVAQLLLKTGAVGEGGIVEQLFRIQTIAGLGLYALAAFFYIVALRTIPISVAFPSVALSYVVVALFGNLWFGEPMGLAHFGGIALIVTGVVLLHAV